MARGTREFGRMQLAIKRLQESQQSVPRSTTAALEDVGDDINTVGKFAGKLVINETSGALVTAAGATAGGVWLALDGTTAHTPV